MDRIEVGIVGCGGLPQQLLLPCLATIPEIHLAGVCDLVEDRARLVAGRYEAPLWTTDWQELLDLEGLEAVMVVAPPAVHEEVGIEALRRGLHLFVEKPPAMTAKGARRLAEAAEGKGLKTLVGTVQRHVPVHVMMKERINSAEFGKPLLLQARYCAPGPGMRMDWGMDRGSEDEMYRFFLLDHIIHHVDLMRFLMGEIIKVGSVRIMGFEDRQGFAVNLEFETGACGSMSCYFRAPSFENNVVIFGDGPAAIEADNWTHLRYRPPSPPLGRGGYEDSPTVEWKGGISFQEGVFRPGYREELSLWARAILGGERCHATLEDGWRDMLVVEAIHRSLLTGEKQEILC
jgi:predicted dehydrogenase